MKLRRSPKPSPKSSSPGLVFPGTTGWELWTQQTGHWICAGPAERPGKLQPPPGCVVGIPSRNFFSLPLWVPHVEETSGRELTALALERKGILGASPESAIWSSEVIRTETVPGADGDQGSAARQLEATAILAVPYREEWLVEEAARHEPAGRSLPAPPGGTAGVVRRELGQWVLDLYSGGKWLHSQPLLAPRLDASAAAEIRSLLFQFEGEEIVTALQQLQVWEEIPDPEFLSGLPFPVQTVPRSAPAPASRPWNLPPPALTERRAAREEKKVQGQRIRWAVVAYAGLVALAFLYWLFPVVRLRLVQAELQRIREPAEKIRETSNAWREAGAWLDPRLNVLEVLWQVSRPLIEKEPATIDGVRLTLFDLNPRRVLLQGEGKDLQVVEKYFDWLKKEPTLGMYQWKNPQPRLLPNGNAQFQVEGTPPWAAQGEAGEGEDANPVSP